MAIGVYATVAEADQYNIDHRNLTSWINALVAAKNRALTLSTDYLDDVYESLTQGVRVLHDQERAWPRQGVFLHGFLVPFDELPTLLKEACIEMAFRFNEGAVPYPDRVSTEGSPIKSITKKAGPVSKTVEYAFGDDGMPRFPLINIKMEPLLMARDRLVRR